MSDAQKPHTPPKEHRFKKGQSGNPKGRPKKKSKYERAESPLDKVSAKTFKIRKDGEEQELSITDALRTKQFSEAMKGNQKAISIVFNWIKKREEYAFKRGETKARSVPHVFLETVDPRTADAALRILDIITDDARMDYDCEQPPEVLADPSNNLSKNTQYYVMQPWVVEAAMSRKGRKKQVSQDSLSFALAYTRDGGSVRVPRGYKNDK
jgi:hypothetical protein